MSCSRGETPSADGERPTKKVKFSPQVSISEFLAVPAKDAVTFHALYGTTAAELDAEVRAGGTSFQCEFFNQVFGEGEEVNGYKGLSIDIWIALRSGHCWVDVSYQESKPGADDVQALLAAWWPKPFTTDRQAFITAAAAASDPDWSSLGAPLSSSITAGVGLQEGSLLLYHATLSSTPDWFKELHARLEPLLIFTIDGASFIDADDPKWEVVAAVVQHNGRPYLAGWCALYNFYAWPLSHRPRVAQVLVLPSLQCRGYGRALVAAAYTLARERDAVDLTFEDPAPTLQCLREQLEVEMMAGCEWLTQPAAAAVEAATAAERQLQEAARKLWEAGGQQQQQSGASAAAVTSAAGGDAGGEKPPPPASHLAMPAALQQRVTRDLKIHKHQVPVVWEALLFLQSQLGQVYPSREVCAEAELLLEQLSHLMRRRLEAGAASGAADRAAANKKMVQVEGSEEDWFVYKLPKRVTKDAQQQQQQQAQGGDNDEALDTVSVGRHTITKVAAEEHSERVQDQVQARLKGLARLKRRVQARRRKQTAGS